MKNRNKLFTSIAILGSAIFGMVLTAGTGVFEALGLFNNTRTTSSNATNLILNKDNAYSSGSSQTINTTFGKNPIVFDYSSGCSSFSNAHVNMADGATVGNYWKTNDKNSGINWNNKLTSIESIKPVFNAESGASLQFRASYDGKTSGAWGNFAPLTSNTSFTLASNPYYIELKAVGGSVSLTSCEICFSCIVNTSASGTPVYETKATVNDGTKKTYSVDDSFDNLIGGSTKKRSVTISDSFEVVETLSNGTTRKLNKGEFNYKVNNPSGTQIDTSKAFGTTGTYTAFIKVGSLAEVAYEFSVEERLVEEIVIPATKSMNTGTSGSISVTSISPSNAHNKTITWSSSDTSVATINSSTGAISALKAGTTTIKATATDVGGVASNGCTLTVTDISVTSVTLDKDSLLLYTDDNDVTLTATILPEDATVKNINWSSNNTSVVTVENGVVHPIGVGTAVITATSGSASDTCAVEVKDASERPVIVNVPITGGTNGSECTVNGNDGIKIGTSSKSGDFTITVPSGATKLYVYIAAWNGSTNTEMSITPASKVSNSTLSISANNGIAGNSPFTLSEGSDEEDYLFEISLVGITTETTLTFASGKRCVAWGASCLSSGGSSSTVELTSISISDYKTQFTVGESFSFGGTVTANYNNGEHVNVTDSATFGGYDKDTIGNQTITVSYGGKTITYIITVNSVVHPQSVSLSPETATIKVGEDITLTATVNPSNSSNKNVTWSSNKPEIATVNNGIVTGVSKGTATITVSTVDGNKTDTCEITVQGSSTPASGDIIIDTSELAGYSDNATATYTGSDNNNYTFNVSNVGSFGSGVQFKASCGFVSNTTALSIMSIELVTQNNKDFDGVLYWGSSMNPSGNNVDVEDGNTYTNPGQYTYFKLLKDSSGAGYLKQIIIHLGSFEPTNPEGISIPSTTSIGVGQKTTLDVTYYPSYCNQNKGVTWSISETNPSGCATINTLTGEITGVAPGTAKVTATSTFDSSFKSSCVVTITEVQKDAWTIMIYMCGSTLEYDSTATTKKKGFATSDLKQMLNVSLPDDVNVIIETGGVDGEWSLGSSYFDTSLPTAQRKISNTNLQRWEIKNQKLSLISNLSTNEMSKQSEVQSFLEWGINDYPAENTGVIFWNHGGGIGGVCSDENYLESYEYEGETYYYSNNLNCEEIARASKAALDSTGADKFTWIGYDACLMGVADLATVNADYYDYMVASQETEPGSGWDYNSFFTSLIKNKENSKNNIELILDEICTSFIDENCSHGDCGLYDRYYEEYYYCYSTLAVYDLSKASNLINAFNAYAENLNISNTNGYKKIKNAYTNCYSYGEDSDGSLYGNGDFIDFLDEMDKQFTTVSSANVRSAIKDIVISNHYCPYYTQNKNLIPCGICVFVPEALRNGDSDYGLQCYKEDYEGTYATKFSAWQTIVRKYGTW
ncbi:MAG: Ig-like domain-containing protein [Bacilli bacterium]|nr:Ig-like domain-containing protein [Bacilli bacterium]